MSQARRHPGRRRIGVAAALAVVTPALLVAITHQMQTDWRTIRTFQGPGGHVVTATITPDGTRAATVTSDGHACLWDTATGNRLAHHHFPDTHPCGIAIRDQGDAVAVLFSSKWPVIWWCGNDVVLPIQEDVWQPIAAFTHSSAQLVLLDVTSDLSVWDAHTGALDHRSGVEVHQLRPFVTQLIVSTDDQYAAVLDPHTPQVTVHALHGGLETRDLDLPLRPENAKVGRVIPDELLNASFLAWTGAPNMDEHEQRLAQAFSGQEVSTTWRSNNHASEGAYLRPQVPHRPERLLLAGPAGTTRLMQRTGWPNATTAALAGFLAAALLGWIVWFVRRPRHRPTPPTLTTIDAAMPLPRAASAVAWFAAALAAYSIAGMVYEVIAQDHFVLDLGPVLMLLAFFGIRRKRNGWRIFVVVIAWVALVSAGGMLGTLLLAGQPLDMMAGARRVQAPRWLGTLTALALLAAAGCVLHVMTRPDVVRVFRAGTEFSQWEDAMKRFRRCKSCGYDTRVTHIDGRRECPECGANLPFPSSNQRDALRDELARKP